jgi:hypothetical protein
MGVMSHWAAAVNSCSCRLAILSRAAELMRCSWKIMQINAKQILAVKSSRYLNRNAVVMSP